ncbi:ABC-type transport system ATP-binding protein (probable substrate glucose) [Natronomonas moolapensis 8.8.11]|uniref:ABC-type transport system ATP-binding protein (Probable substrate glucose) n=1 Tax=Natronomonas moolapensis (strain DSM 18674 / CECT 7526 / JCM 14361 / 8.8.11) TaxID=268739 RepID=M1XLH7_NATM8|nr:ABC transporter ATP-binding protein [Natronomonas moolapensis]CCQ37739.1 ABC-type transport system ATP-binding protein (probable substrate glucose) [Natronomonas moolapensis 8.8.11]
MSESPFLELDGILKQFPGVVANDHVDLRVERGEIHGLLGENGAGKSTLMKVLYGLYTQDSGAIYLDGDRLELASPQDAIDAGIGMVHQHFQLIPRLSVAENVVLGEREPASAFRINETSGGLVPESVRSNDIVRSLAQLFSLGLDVPKRRIQQLADQYGFDIDPDAKVWELDVGQQQRVEILKALYRDVDLLILDEPTAVLTPTEADQLFDSLERLAEGGLSVIFITHKLAEVEAVVDRVTILQDGENAGTAVVSEVSKADLAEMMVGREVLFDIEQDETERGDPVLELRNVSAESDRGIEALSGIDLTVREGEVVGVAGVSGNGQKELAEVTAGIRGVTGGSILIGGTDLAGSTPKEFVENDVSFVPEDRLRYGCAAELPIRHNAAMKEFTDARFGGKTSLSYDELTAYAETLVEEFDVRGVDSVAETKAGDLSGGNLQKLILARELSRDPDLLIANQPTRGVDVGAIEFIREALLEQRQNGTGTLLISENLDEITDLSDRILVIYEGEFVHETTPEAADRDRIGLEMNGGGTGNDTDGRRKRGGSRSPTAVANEHGAKRR